MTNNFKLPETDIYKRAEQNPYTYEELIELSKAIAPHVRKATHLLDTLDTLMLMGTMSGKPLKWCFRQIFGYVPGVNSFVPNVTGVILPPDPTETGPVKIKKDKKKKSKGKKPVGVDCYGWDKVKK